MVALCFVKRATTKTIATPARTLPSAPLPHWWLRVGCSFLRHGAGARAHNVIAVEVHDGDATDLRFDLLLALPCGAALSLPRAPCPCVVPAPEGAVLPAPARMNKGGFSPGCVMRDWGHACLHLPRALGGAGVSRAWVSGCALCWPTALLTPLCLPAGTAVFIPRGPYLMAASASGMTVRWQTDRAGLGAVRFAATTLPSVTALDGAGQAATREWRTVPSVRCPGYDHEVVLTDLAPATVYLYQVS
jgi:hypothetical protein